MAEIAKIKGYDIRDKKLADATSQSTVAATDAIEMKTTSGDQVYITRDSFVQAMASVLNSNSQSTISQLFGADANGNHAAINMSNLATLLGIMEIRTTTQFAPLDDVGNYMALIAGIGMQISFYDKVHNTCIQFAYNTYDYTSIRVRNYNYVSNQWNSWKNITS